MYVGTYIVFDRIGVMYETNVYIRKHSCTLATVYLIICIVVRITCTSVILSRFHTEVEVIIMRMRIRILPRSTCTYVQCPS